MLKFLYDCELEVITSFDEEADAISGKENLVIKAGETFDDTDNGNSDIQFGDGSVAFGVPCSLFEECGP